MNIRMVTRGAIIAAMYVVLTISPGLNAISFYQAQFRISEMLMPLALFDLAAVPGLWIGCLIANADDAGRLPLLHQRRPRKSNTGLDRKSTRLNSSHTDISRMPSSA